MTRAAKVRERRDRLGSDIDRQSRRTSGWLQGLPGDAWTRRSVLPSWSVHELVAHLAIVHASLARTITVASDDRATPLAAYLATYGEAGEDLAHSAVELAGRRSPAELIVDIDRSRELAVARLNAAPEIVSSVRGPITLLDFLSTRVVELVVHTDDLIRSVNAPGGGGKDLSGVLDAEALETAADVLCAASGQDWDAAQGVDPLNVVRVLAGRITSTGTSGTAAWKPVLS